MPPKKAPTKTQAQAEIAEKSGVSKADVAKVFSALEGVMTKSLREHHQFTMFGLFKVSVVRKEATKARPGRNPFTGEQTTFKAKPAHNVVRVRPLKRLKDMVSS
jgi:nucleoid DNA-binding protein